MAQLVTRAQSAMQRIGVARGTLAVLSRADDGLMETILRRYAGWYRISPNAMTVARTMEEATLADCAGSLLKSLSRLDEDASFIRGFTPIDARRVNPHLQVLGAECEAFASAQAGTGQVEPALRRFCESGMGSGSFAGSALVR